MLLSIGGVLVAGSAAALVNSAGARRPVEWRAADGDGGEHDVDPDRGAARRRRRPSHLLAVTSPPTTLPPSTAVPIVVTAPPTTTTHDAHPRRHRGRRDGPAGGTQATYRLGDAGTALLDTAGGRLTIVHVTPAPGWSVDRAESDGTSVEIRLESASGEVRFEASLVRGVVRVSLETDDDSTVEDSGSGSGNSGHGGGGDDDNSGPGSGD